MTEESAARSETTHAVLLLVLPVITTAVGYLSGQSALAVPMLFCLFAGAYLTYTLVPLRAQVDDGVGALILHIGYGITRGATWVGQLGCVGLLALWFL